MNVVEALGQIEEMQPMSTLHEAGLVWSDCLASESLSIAGKWSRFASRVQEKRAWHHRGVLLQIVRFSKQVRGLPFPAPSCRDMSDYLQQSRYARQQHALGQVREEHLQQLFKWRRLVGHMNAFCPEHPIGDALQYLRSARQVMTHQGLRAAEERVQMATLEGGSAYTALLGPKGGLPKRKPELQLLCRTLGLADTGTVDDLRVRLKTQLSLADRQLLRAGGVTTVPKAAGPPPAATAADPAADAASQDPMALPLGGPSAVRRSGSHPGATRPQPQEPRWRAPPASQQLQQILAKATVRVGGGSSPPVKAAPSVPTLFPAPLQQTAAAFSPVPPPTFHTAHELSSADDPMAASQPSAASTLAVATESPAEIMRKALALTGHDKSGKGKGNRH
jgi:hypothetical protein